MPKIIIAGSRSMDDYNLMARTWHEYTKKYGLKNDQITIITGGASGADKLTEQMAKRYRIRCEVMRADWQTHDRSAGHIRNAEMAKAAGADGRLLTFWDGQSPGTAGMIKQTRRADLHVEIVHIAIQRFVRVEQLTL